MSDAQENTKLMEMIKTLQSLKMKLSKEIVMLKWTEAEVKMDFKRPITQLAN